MQLAWLRGVVDGHGEVLGRPAESADLVVTAQQRLVLPVQRHARDLVAATVCTQEHEGVVVLPVHRHRVRHLDIAELPRLAGGGVVQPQPSHGVARLHCPRERDVAARRRPHGLHGVCMGIHHAHMVFAIGRASPQIGFMRKAAFAGADVGKLLAVVRDAVRQHVEGSVGQLGAIARGRIDLEQVDLAREQIAHAVGFVGQLPDHLGRSFRARGCSLGAACAAQVRIHRHRRRRQQGPAVRHPAQAGGPARQLAELARFAAAGACVTRRGHAQQIDLRAAIAVGDKGQLAAIGRPVGRVVVAVALRDLGACPARRCSRRVGPDLGAVAVVLTVDRLDRARDTFVRGRAFQFGDFEMQIQIGRFKRLRRFGKAVPVFLHVSSSTLSG
ncbi:hypothetical protein ACFQOZ_19805 [Comamonas endophytica]|uniref:hypothetical protein n=1 Tax=Comamonas endophytica TaxID=2949090 RepID=UPI00361AFD5E